MDKRAAIRRLRTGVVPAWALEDLSVAYDEIRKRVDSRLEDTLEGRRPRPLFIAGEWGAGKTHLISFIQASARKLGVPCAVVTLDASGLSLNKPQRLYAQIANVIGVEAHVGLRSVLNRLLRNTEQRRTLAKFAGRTEAGELAWPLAFLCSLADRGEDLVLDDHYAWSVILGLDLNWADYSYKRRPAINRVIALSHMFAAVGLGGMVLLFDETETIDQLYNIRSRLTAYSTIGSWSHAKHLWTVFGITERFGRTVEGDLFRLPEVGSSPDEHAARVLKGWRTESFEVAKPPEIAEKFVAEVAARVARLYQEAYGVRATAAALTKAIQDWRTNPVRNPRRLIRRLVEEIDDGRELSLGQVIQAHGRRSS
ncbi:MAG: DUF2791 family P-loop domain-containing protein [Burkholderiales bacterium]|nr:DUF2791 family P-loop domain-containing protein [Burkholderiales bacterium]